MPIHVPNFLHAWVFPQALLILAITVSGHELFASWVENQAADLGVSIITVQQSTLIDIPKFHGLVDRPASAAD